MSGTKRGAITTVLIALLLLCCAAPALAAGETYVVPIRGDIDNGNWLFVERACREAEAAGAGAIIFEIDTYGGYVDAAIRIADLILALPLPTYCYVDTKAVSAGSLIALAGEKLLMTPGATIGAAEPRVLGQEVDYKTLSMWAGKLSSVAESRGRDGDIAAAFADVDSTIEGLTETGQLLTLTASQAQQYGIADHIFSKRADIIAEFALSETLVVMEKTFQEKAGGWLSDPWISGILLTIGIAGVVIEILTAGSFGVFGAAGLISFALYFMGHFWVGNIGVGAILLFAVGLVLILLEIFIIPGFGVTGVLGILATLSSLVLASPNMTQAMLTLGCSLLAAIILIVITLKNKKTRKVWSKLILSQKLDTEGGYVSNDTTLAAYLGKRGRAVTTLRPAGVAEIDGRRIDVVTAGEFIDPGTMIEVILVEGTRVVVRET